MDKLIDKVAVVTGGNSGIVKAIAIRFANEGANVIIVGRNEDTLKSYRVYQHLNGRIQHG